MLGQFLNLRGGQNSDNLSDSPQNMIWERQKYPQ